MSTSFANSNIALFGTELELKIKQASADSEEAGVGTQPGITKWRVHNFRLEKQSQQDLVNFYDGDSYVVLITTLGGAGADHDTTPLLEHAIYYWIGTFTTADESGTAAYKTFELGAHFERKATHHRETAYHETDGFLAYFEVFGGLRVLSGGYDSGFHHVVPATFHPRLLQIKGRRVAKATQVPQHCSSLRAGDVFLLDNGTVLFQWNGEGASIRERVRAAQLARSISDARGGIPIIVGEQSEGMQHAIIPYLDGSIGDIKTTPTEDEGDDVPVAARVWRYNGVSFEYDASVKRCADLDSNGIFIVDVAVAIYIWIGSATTLHHVHANATAFTQSFLFQNNRPEWTPITIVYERGNTQTFQLLFE